MFVRTPLGTAALTAVLALAACTSADDVGWTAEGVKVYECQELACGNAAKMENKSFFELKMDGSEYSPLGRFKIVSFTQAGVPLTLKVFGFELTGINPFGVPLQRAALVNSIITVQEKGGATFKLTLQSFTQTDFKEGGSVPFNQRPPSYAFKYTKVGASHQLPKFVCPRGESEPSQAYAFLYRGDRYDYKTGRVIETGPGAWFNFTCKDDALFKLAWFRHVTAASGGGYGTNVNDRDAALMSIRADYCGDNHSYTELNTDVDWVNRGLWLTQDPDSGEDLVEAIWDNTGAICVSNPRVDENTVEDIHCGKEVCTPEQIDNWVADGKSMITYRPPYP